MTLAETDFPTDVRVENEAIRLLAADHQVTLVAEKQKHRERTSQWQGIEVIRFPRLPTPLRQIHGFIRFHFHFNLSWFVLLAWLQRHKRFDVFHVHDLPLAGTVLFLGRLVRRPVILDFHENYPVALQTYHPHPAGFLGQVQHWLFYDLVRWKKYEQKSARASTHIIVVVDEARNRLGQLGISPAKVTVVSNTLNVPHFESFPVLADIQVKYVDKFVISYVGTAARYRFIQTIIRALPVVLRSIHNAHLLIVGNANLHDWLQNLVKTLELAEYVTFTGAQPFSYIPSYIAATTVGVMPHQPNEHTNNTIPHKLFQYMYFEKPVVVSNCAPLARIVSETGCGLVCAADVEDAEAWAQTIISLAEADIRKQMGRLGRQAVLDRYNWSFDAERLAHLYLSLNNASAGS